MAQATAGAGKTGASSVRGNSYLPRVNIWRTVLKTLLPRENPISWGGPHRWVKNMAKGFLLVTICTSPHWFVNKYGAQELKMKYFGNGDPRWENTPSIGLYNLKERSLVWDPMLVLKEDPWKNYLPGYNSIPWEQRTEHDDPDEERGWKAFGDGMPHKHMMRGFLGSLTQKQNMFHLFSVQDEYTSFSAFYLKTLGRSVQMWMQDVYYNYYHVFFHVPVEERYEGMGQMHGQSRRIIRRWWCESTGWAGWKAVGVYGGLIFPGSDFSSMA
ncbi:hypothetical protein DIPPA_25521 [Diplonema papillatum]|nr:hypothetical protein DIPPA_25521 [Diplonema papillatum]